MIFDSARHKIARAKRHTEELDSLEQNFLRDKCGRVIVEVDPATGDKIQKLKFSEPVPLECSSVVSDAANNLRDALDHACNAIAVAAGKIDPRYAVFPFAGTADDLENAIRGRSKDLPDEILALLRTFKPYKGGNEILVALNAVANANKHGLLRPMARASGAVNMHVGKVSGGHFGIPSDAFAWNSAENEIIIARYGRHAQVNYNFQVQVFIAFNEATLIYGDPAVVILDGFRAEVSRTVDALEAEARRIGVAV